MECSRLVGSVFANISLTRHINFFSPRCMKYHGIDWNWQESPWNLDSNRDQEEWCVLFSVFKGESDLESDFFFWEGVDFFLYIFAIYFVLTGVGLFLFFLLVFWSDRFCLFFFFLPFFFTFGFSFLFRFFHPVFGSDQFGFFFFFDPVFFARFFYGRRKHLLFLFWIRQIFFARFFYGRRKHLLF